MAASTRLGRLSTYPNAITLIRPLATGPFIWCCIQTPAHRGYGVAGAGALWADRGQRPARRLDGAATPRGERLRAGVGSPLRRGLYSGVTRRLCLARMGAVVAARRHCLGLRPLRPAVVAGRVSNERADAHRQPSGTSGRHSQLRHRRMDRVRSVSGTPAVGVEHRSPRLYPAGGSGAAVGPAASVRLTAPATPRRILEGEGHKRQPDEAVERHEGDVRHEAIGEDFAPRNRSPQTHRARRLARCQDGPPCLGRKPPKRRWATWRTAAPAARRRQRVAGRLVAR